MADKLEDSVVTTSVVSTGPVDVSIYTDLSTNPEPVFLGPKHGNKDEINWNNLTPFDVTVTMEREITGGPDDPKSPFPSDQFTVHPGIPLPSGKIKDSSKKHQEYKYSVESITGKKDPTVIIDR